MSEGLLKSLQEEKELIAKMEQRMLCETPNWENIDLEQTRDSELGRMRVNQIYDMVSLARQRLLLYPKDGYLDSQEFGNLGLASFKLKSNNETVSEALQKIYFHNLELQSISKDSLVENQPRNYCEINTITKQRLTATLNPKFERNILSDMLISDPIINPEWTEKGFTSLRPYILINFRGKKNKHPREQDTEFKFLEHFLIQIQEAGIHRNDFKKITGTLEIFTERTVCESCANVIRMFCLLFPNIKLKTIGGFSKNYNYAIQV